jgi:hypothetical protein
VCNPDLGDIPPVLLVHRRSDSRSELERRPTS